MEDEIQTLELDANIGKDILEGLERLRKAYDEALAKGYVSEKTYFKARRKDFTKVYECPDYKCDAHPRGCLFCKHCTDVWWDFSNGPYMNMCDIETDDKDITRKGFIGKCKHFEEEKLKEEKV